MRQIRPEYEFPIEGRAWTRGELPTAGVFFLDGDCHIVAQHGPAAMELEERGALLVAVVRFDRDVREGRTSGASIRPLGLQEAVARFTYLERSAEGAPASRVRIQRALEGESPDGDF